MPITVDVPELGRPVEFPDDMSHDDIASAITQHLGSIAESGLKQAVGVSEKSASMFNMGRKAQELGLREKAKAELKRQQREAQVAGDIAASEAASAGVGEQVAEFARTFPQRAVKAPFELAQAAGIPIGKPTLSPDDIAYLRSKYAELQSPLIGPQQAGPKEQAITDWLNEQASGMTTPEMPAAIGTPVLAKLAKMSPEAIQAAGRVIARGFQAQMAAGVPEAVQATVEAPDTPSRIKAGLSATSAVGLPLAIEAGLTKPTPKIPDYPGSRIQSQERGVVTALGNEEMQAEAKKQAAMLELGRAAAKDLVPAIETPEGRVVTGEDHVGAYSEAKSTGTPDTSGSKEGFLNTKTGEFQSREKSAEQTGLPTETEAGKLHSSDLAKAQEAQPPPPTPAPVKAEPSGAKEPPPKTGENLIIRPRTDGMVSLQDVKGAQIGTFKTLEEAAKWARENGYGIAAGSPLKPKSAEPVKLENQPWKMTRDEFFDEVITGTPIVKTDSGKFFAGWDHAAAKDLAEDNGERISGPLGAAAGWRKFGRNIMASELEMDKNQAHQAIVEEALKAGKPVPREVLADYPDLKPQAEPSGRDWDAFTEELIGELDSFSPARHTGRENYELNDVADRFAQFAKADTSGKPLDKLVSDFAKVDEASQSQIRKLRQGVKSLLAQEKLAEPSAPPPPAQPKGETGGKVPASVHKDPSGRPVEASSPETGRQYFRKDPDSGKWMRVRYEGISGKMDQHQIHEWTWMDGPQKGSKSSQYGQGGFFAAKSQVAEPYVPEHGTVTDRFRTEQELRNVRSQARTAQGNTRTRLNEKARLLAERLKQIDAYAAEEEAKAKSPPTPPPVEQKGVEPEKGPGIVGMGGATPQEFEQPGTYVSNMFAAIDRDRAELGKPPMDPTVRRSWGEDNQRALAQMNRDPNWIPNLISEVLKRPRPLLSWENAGLVWQRAFWKTEYNNALKRIAQAFDDNRTEDLTAAKTDAAVFEDKLEELDRAVGRNGTGSEAGRTLQAQKMGAGDDFTLIEMTLQKRAAVGGRRLTAEESANLAKEHARLEALNSELQKELATRDERLAKSEADRAMAELKAKNAPTFDKRILAAAENIVSKMETAADAARERIKARFAQPGAMSGPIDPTLIDDFAVVASAKIARAGLDLAKLTDDMAREFGEMVKEHMPAIWTRANEMLDNITAKVPDPVKRMVRKQGLDEQKQVFIENIKEKAAKGEKKSFNWYVQKMARELYKSGITERDDLINALHGLLKQAVPDITLRQTQDAFSGYGDYKPLSKNEITVALRGMKGELQQIAKLEDMEKGKPPLKSGMERRTPTEVERKLIKLVNDAKNKFQVPVSDPETQLKSALDTLKTTLENRIKDYADRLARKDFSPRPRREIVLDSRANQLKVEAERIKKRFREELIADRLKNRNPWEKVMDWGTKLRRFDILSSPVVIPKLISAGIQRLTSLPLEEEVGGVFKRIPGYKQVFEKAPLEGGGRNLSAEMVGFKSAFMKGLKDAYDVLKTGHSELDVLYGKAGESYTGEFELMSKLLAMPGRIHGMIKAPVKRATFERAVERYAKHYLSQGIPVDDVLKTRIALDAYKAANRSIFLNDNRIALAFNAALRTAEQPLKETGHPTAGGKALATLGRVTIPIVKVPLNIVAETTQYATGLISGNVRLANAFRRGIETLTPEQADLIARELKKGSIGAAILMLGYANADAIGGYYQPGTKKKPGQPKWGSINVFGVNVPSFLLHNPLLETLQIGATIRQVADSKLKKRDKTTQGLSEGVLAAAFGVVEQTPFMREMAEIEKLRNPYTRDRFFGEQAKSLVVPAVVSKAAEWMDTLNPNLQRKPRTTTEYIKSGIPGLRQQLPAERKK